MDGYTGFKTPQSLYGNSNSFATESLKTIDDNDLIRKYTSLYKSVVKEIYDQKIGAYKDFYSFCMYNVINGKDEIEIGKSDFFLIQSFIFIRLKNYLKEELSTLEDQIALSFDFDSASFSATKNKSLVEKILAGAQQQGEAYLKAQATGITDNFNLKKQFGNLEKVLNGNQDKLTLLKVQYLDKDPLKKNVIGSTQIKILKLNINYNSFAIKALKVLSSFNLISFISSILIDVIYDELSVDVLSDFKKMDVYVEKIKDRDTYFQMVKNQFDNGIDTLFEDYYQDLKSIYTNTIQSGNTAEKELLLFQVSKFYELLKEFVSEIDLEIKDNGANVSNTYKSNVLLQKSNAEYSFLMEQWAYFNLGNDGKEPKKTSIYGPSPSKWYRALEYAPKFNKVLKEEKTYVNYRERINVYPVGLQLENYLFLKQFLHEGLKFGLAYNALSKKHYATSRILRKSVRENKDIIDFDTFGIGTQDEHRRKFIELGAEKIKWKFNAKEIFNTNQLLFYFDTCDGNITGIKEDKIQSVELNILDVNVDEDNDIICLDDVEFKINYLDKNDKLQSRTTSEWISGF